MSVVDAVGEGLTQDTPVGDELFISRGLSRDEIVARIPKDVEVLAVSCMFSQDWPYLRGLAGGLREHFPNAPIVAGGEHVTALPEFVIRDSAIDHCVLGEGEQTFADLLDALSTGRPLENVPGLVTRRNGEIIRTEPRARIRSIDDIARPAWDLFPIENYLAHGKSFGVDRGRCMPILATRGCPYRCTFCSSPTMWTTRWLARDPAAVLDEIREYIERYDVQNVDFYDLTAIIKREWILEFCRLVKESGLKFTWQLPTGTRSEAIDEIVAEALHETGCRNMTYAPESGSVKELDRIKKRIKLQNVLRSMRACYTRQIEVKANIVMGFPGQTFRDLLDTLYFIARMAVVGTRDIMIYTFCPYPGSELYRELRAEGRLPEPSDEHFYSLISQMDFSRSVSFNQGFSDRQLNLARFTGMLLFYIVCFLVRPWRLVQSAYRMWTGRYETYFEDRLSSFVKRMLTVGAKETEAGGRPPQPETDRAVRPKR